MNKFMDIIRCEKGVEDASAEKKSESPIDRWRFLVLLAATFTMVLVNISLITYGILFSRLLINDEISSTTVSWIFNIALFMWHLCMIIAGPLCETFGHRKVAFITGLLYAFSIGTSGLLVEGQASFLFLLFSIVTGMCCGILMATCNFIVPLYFLEKKGSALSFMYIGFASAQFVGPPLVYHLQETYGKVPATYIFGAILLNICLCSLVFHPPEWHKKSAAKDYEVTASGIEAKTDQPRSSATDSESKETSTHKSENSFSETITTLAKSVAENVAMIRSFRVGIIAFSVSLAIAAQLNLVMIIPFTFNSRGVSMEQISTYISISGASNMAFRVILFLIIDFVPISSKWYCILGMTTTAASCLILSFFTQPTLIITTMVIWGLSAGIVTVLPLVVLEYIGKKYYSGTYGVWGLVNGCMFIIVGPIVGAIRDYTGNYEYCLQFLSAVAIAGPLLWVFMPLAVSYDKRKNILPKDDEQES